RTPLNVAWMARSSSTMRMCSPLIAQTSTAAEAAAARRPAGSSITKRLPLGRLFSPQKVARGGVGHRGAGAPRVGKPDRLDHHLARLPHRLHRIVHEVEHRALDLVR